MHLVNARTETVLASSVEVARTSAARRRGLLGRNELPRGSALVISRCNAIHTIGMRFAIDVAFVDSGGRVKKIVTGLPPWRIAVSPLASMAIEFTAGVLQPDVLRVGDWLYLVPQQPNSRDPELPTAA
jgi:uncharacterized membrane protein (UPF0127 family)